jgi:hypothetical protein
MEEEILNIEYHTKRLVLKALNQEETIEAAANQLNISVRTLHRYKVKYNIQLVKDQYQIIEKQKHENTYSGCPVSDVLPNS